MKQLVGCVWLLLWSSLLLPTIFSSMIIHGRNATDGEVPFQVSLHDKGNGFACGGVILNEHWVLTAGHCIDSSLKSVSYNTLDLYSGDIVPIDKVIRHPKYSEEPNKQNDIGLVRTADPIKLNQTNAKAVKLSKKNQDHLKEGDTFIASGWGMLAPDEFALAKYLHIVSIPVLSNQNCTKLLKPEEVPFLGEQMLCAGERGDQSKGTCKGDSGGPGTVNGVLQGITSWRQRHCAVRPSVYTRVSHYLDWIHRHTNHVFLITYLTILYILLFCNQLSKN